MARLTWNHAELLRKAKKEGMEMLIDSAEIIKEHIKKSMPEQGSHKAYTRPWGIHYSSRPGNPPAVDYGRLRDSISINWKEGIYANGEVGPNALFSDGVKKPRTLNTVVIGTNVPYASDLENPSSKRGNRQFLTPVLPFAHALIKKNSDKLPYATFTISEVKRK